jgi:16S rRNA G1207 methylase RsmC
MRDTLETALGSFTLQRYPQRPGEQLQAWNNADQLLLEMAVERGVPAPQILVVNDEHGALSIPLGGCTVWTDSALSEQAIANNSLANTLQHPPRVRMLNDTLPDSFQLVLLRMPKHLGLLRWQLQLLRQTLPAGTVLIAASMQKHLGPGREKIFEEYFGPTQRHEGWRKARAFTAVLDPARSGPLQGLSHWDCEILEMPMSAWPGVFSAGQLDQGTRFMLENLPPLEARLAVDLACGSGELGLYLAQRTDFESLVFIDESAMAVASARHNTLSLPSAVQRRCHFVQADGFEGWQDEAPDLVLCNPPFHFEHTVDDFAGRRLIEQTARTIAAGGELWLVANRHLLYGRTLRSSFREVKQHAQNNKFILWQARK